MLVRTCLLVICGMGGCLVALGAAEPETVLLDGGESVIDRTITGTGLTLRATTPTHLRGELRFAATAPDGVTLTVIRRSLRGVLEDDWRTRDDVAGTRQDAVIDVGQAAGTPADRARFGIGGSDRDWDNFSYQWDGVIEIPSEGAELGTASDDGSRVWLDRNGDGAIQLEEWGGNGWGGGQGVTTRLVHPLIPVGRYRIRVQYEEGGGGNACKLVWRRSDGTWSTVPATAFNPRPTLHLLGPITVEAAVHGDGHVRAGDDVRLAGPIAARSLTIAGPVALAGDLDASALPLHVLPTGQLDLAGFTLRGHHLTGAGRIALTDGALIVAGTALGCAVRGPGSLQPLAPRLHAPDVADDVALLGATYVVTGTDRVRARVPAGGPLTHIIPIARERSGELRVTISLTVPADAPADLGVGAFRSDRHGRWFQRLHPGPLAPGTHDIQLDLGAEDQLIAEEHRGRWSAAMTAEQDRVGVLLFGSGSGASAVTLTAEVVDQEPVLPTRSTAAMRLTDLVLDGFSGDAASAETGVRWQLHVRPDPYPHQPYDPERFRLDLRITEPDGRERVFAGFHHQPVTHADRGDREIFRDAGQPFFTVRFRPRLPGRHTLTLVTAVEGHEVTHPLPDLMVTGEPWDDIVRPDPQDPRFFSAGGRFVWPLGHNLHSTYDTRGVAAVGSRLTPDRGSFTREVLLQRLAAAGGTGCETWLSAWNLGLEWNPAWSGYHGTGRYNTGNAWAVDRFLDLAEELGVRVNLSIFNHGMGRDGEAAEMEWPFHPWSARNGGWLDGPPGLFTDERAFAAQTQLFRYITARYGDSPALLGWKLWAEVDLVHAPNPLKVAWHARASEVLAGLDPYGRAVTSHWCGDWRNADREICAQPHIGYITIDAYHGNNAQLADVLAQSVRDTRRADLGLGGFGKPVWVSEFGGSAFGCPPARLLAEHQVGPWVGFVTGHAGSPLLWWFEWIDQGDHYGVYNALSRFSAGEDLRGKNAQVVAPGVQDSGGIAWCRAWRNGERWLGFVLDPAWGTSGGEGRRWNDATLRVETGSDGPWTIAFWDTENGTVVAEQQIIAIDQAVTVTLPPFSRSLAFKLMRPDSIGRIDPAAR